MSTHICHFKYIYIYIYIYIWDFFQGTQERVRNNRGKRAISVRATEGLHYVVEALCF